MRCTEYVEKKVRVATIEDGPGSGRTLNHRRRLGSLDGLRGLAALMVLCHHLCPFPGGHPVAMVCATLWLGVDLFFVLSGFLITGVLYDTLGQKGFFRVFYARRALRLIPLYGVVVAMVIALNAAMGGRLTVWAVPYFVYASNIVRDMGLPIGVVPRLDVSHLWSLAIEEQFYLLWPLAMFLARTRARVLWLCGAGVMLSVGLRFVAVAHAGSFALGTPYFELPMRLDGLLLGGAVAVVLRSREGVARLSAAWLYAALAAGALGVVTSFAVAGHGSMFSAPMVKYGYGSAAVLFAAVVGLAARSETLVARGCNQQMLRTLGRYSYGLYLIHLIARPWYLETVARLQGRCSGALAYDVVSVAMFVGYVAWCFGVSVLCYEFVERRFLRRKGRFRYSEERGTMAAREAEMLFQNGAAIDGTT